jgi:Xaa-Pro aminopeptidase
MPRALTLAVLVALAAAASQWPVRAQIPPEGGTTAYAADLAARRARLMSALEPDTVLVLSSAPARNYSADIDYPYRQDSNLFYLTGLVEDGVTLVLVPGATPLREFLFVRQRDPVRELWHGRVTPPEEITRATGIHAVYASPNGDLFQRFMEALLSRRPDSTVPTGERTSFAGLFDALTNGRAKLAIGDPLPSDTGAVPIAGGDNPHVRWAYSMRAKYPAVQLISALPLLQRQRQIKTAYEQRVLTKSAAISAAAHVAGMRATRPGRWEYELKAAIEYAFARNGALSWGYPSIVGSGPNATSLHYLDGTRQMRAGEVVLVDAAGSYQGMTADITRSYPVSGRFTPAQRAIYTLVLSAQDAGIAAARPGAKPDAVTNAIRGVFRTGLRELGLVRAVEGPELEAEVDVWFPHLPIHGIGVDVHDPLGELVPGAAFVIEPGLYIRPDAFERLPASRRAAISEALAPAAARYRDIGIRVEDSFLMTPSGPVMLSAAAPRGIAEIERIVGRSR